MAAFVKSKFALGAARDAAERVEATLADFPHNREIQMCQLEKLWIVGRLNLYQFDHRFFRFRNVVRLDQAIDEQETKLAVMRKIGKRRLDPFGSVACSTESEL